MRVVAVLASEGAAGQASDRHGAGSFARSFIERTPSSSDRPRIAGHDVDRGVMDVGSTPGIPAL